MHCSSDSCAMARGREHMMSARYSGFIDPLAHILILLRSRSLPWKTKHIMCDNLQVKFLRLGDGIRVDSAVIVGKVKELPGVAEGLVGQCDIA